MRKFSCLCTFLTNMNGRLHEESKRKAEAEKAAKDAEVARLSRKSGSSPTATKEGPSIFDRWVFTRLHTHTVCD